MDEPTEALCSEGRNQICALLKGVTAQGRTIVVFSHDEDILKGALRGVSGQRLKGAANVPVAVSQKTGETGICPPFFPEP